MGCCGKVKNIITGYKNLALNKNEAEAKRRIAICYECDKRRYLGRTMWCSVCKCYIPAAVRAEDKHCELGKW